MKDKQWIFWVSPRRRLSKNGSGTRDIPPTGYLVWEILFADTLFLSLFRHLDVFRLNAERPFRPGEFSPKPLAIAAHVKVIEIGEAGKCLAVNAIQSWNQFSSRGSYTEVNVANRLRKGANESEGLTGEPSGICSAGGLNAVYFGSLSIVAKDTRLVLQPSTFQNLGVQHNAEIARRGEGV